ncbi:MAG: type VII secretion target [Actinomycetes bacterium]
MPDQEFRVDPAALRAAARRVQAWSDQVADIGTGGSGRVAQDLDALEPSFEGSALGHAVGAVSVAVTRAGDGLADALRSLGSGLEDAAARYEQADHTAAGGLGERP